MADRWLKNHGHDMPDNRRPDGSGAKLNAAAAVIVEFLLHFVEVAAPLLVRKARVPAVRAVIISAKVANFIALGRAVTSRLAVLVTESATASPFGDRWPAEQTLRLHS